MNIGDYLPPMHTITRRIIQVLDHCNAGHGTTFGDVSVVAVPVESCDWPEFVRETAG